MLTTIQWKPGQLITINGCICRVKKASSQWTVCNECEYSNTFKVCKLHGKFWPSTCINKMSINLYPKIIKLCQEKKE